MSRFSQSLFPVFLGILCFLAGFLCNSFSTPFRIFQLLQTLSNENEISSHHPFSDVRVTINQTNDIHFTQPLGLDWFQQGYENPWSFSTMRTDVNDLEKAFHRVIQRDGKLPRVVVSFTSLPKRFIKHAYSMVKLIKHQTYIPDMIYICVPKDSRRSNDTFDIPRWMTEDPLITILRPDIDYGPATKLIPTIEAEQILGNTKTRIITVDDDNEGGWNNDSVLKILSYSLHFEDEALGFTGWNVTCMVKDARCSPEDSGIPFRQARSKKYNFIKQADDYACHSLADWKKEYYPNCMGAVRKNYVAFTDVIEGYKGALYQPRFFNLKEIKDIVNESTPKYFLLCDDVWFSGWLGVNKFSKLIINPALHDNASVRKALIKYSDGRNISREVVPMDKESKLIYENINTVEGGLHSMGFSFVQANHLGVQWFEHHHAWTEEMWTRPKGFKYLSERNESVLIGIR